MAKNNRAIAVVGTLLAGGLVPVLFSVCLEYWLPNWRWEQLPFHALIEGLGAFAAVTLAVLILTLRRYNRLTPLHVWVASALLGMGLLDGFHAACHAGKLFVWLHSTASFVGGVLFAGIWFPDRVSNHRVTRMLPAATLVLTTIFAVASVAWPGWLPAMAGPGGFTAAAKALNMIGAAGFLIAAAHFAFCYSGAEGDDSLLFTNHCLLFGIAGLLFEFSVLWDAAWWSWHFVRLLAYGIALYYFFVLFYKSQRDLQRSHAELERRVEHRTRQLEQRASELETSQAAALDMMKDVEAARQWAENAERNLQRQAQQLSRANVELTRSNKELEQFAYVASHDLQEPLRKVSAFGDMLKSKYREALGDEGRDFLDRMQNAAQRMQTLINALLTYSRVISKAQPFKKIDLAAVAREVLSDLEVRLRDTGGRVEVGDLPAIDAEPTQMRQLLQNLIGNGLKYCRDEVPPVVTVTGRILDNGVAQVLAGSSAESVVEITVADNGIGFEEQYAERIFTPFQRLHGRGQYEGTGIGLAVCRKIVERHGGTITARGAPGEGSTFLVTLPVAQPTGAATHE